MASGTLQVKDTGVVGGLRAAGIAGNGTASVVLTRTVAEINASSGDATGLQYLSGAGYVGADTLTVLTSDQGATGKRWTADGQRSGGNHGECCASR